MWPSSNRTYRGVFFLLFAVGFPWIHEIIPK